MQRCSTVSTVGWAVIFLMVWLIPPALLAAQDTTFYIYQPHSEQKTITRAYYKAFTRVSAESITAIPNITAADFDVTENGVPISAASITHNCLTNNNPAMSVVLVVDKSGSMGQPLNPPDTRTHFDVVKTALKSFVSTVQFTPPTTVAVVSFDALSYVEQNFTNDKGLLYKAIDSITLGGDTRYNSPLLDGTKGAIPLLSTRPPQPIKRAVIFLTDGLPNQLDPVQRDSIIRGLLGTNVRFFGISVWSELNSNISDFAKITGGQTYTVTTGDIEGQLTSIYKEIANFLQQQSSECYIEWPSQVSCTEEATAKVTFKKASKPLTDESTYLSDYVFHATFEPQKLDFGNPPVGQPITKQFSITTNVDATIVSPTVAISCGTFSFIGFNSPETFKANVPRVFDVRYVATTGQPSCIGTISFNGTPCNLPPIELQAGAPSGVDDNTENGNAFTVLPSPATDVAEVMLPLSSPSQVRIELLAPDGRTLQIMDAEGNAGMNRFTLSLFGIPSGVYAVRLRAGSFGDVQKIAVVK